MENDVTGSEHDGRNVTVKVRNSYDRITLERKNRNHEH
jgi:hypothetical protein